MFRLRIFLVVAASLLALLLVSTAAGGQAQTQGLAGQWHRLNESQSNPAPEHEHLVCHQSNGGAVWTCLYDKLPEPHLNFFWNTTRGTFTGVDVTATWVCPFAADFCQSVTSVVAGVFDVRPAVGAPVSLRQDFIVTSDGITETLFVYFVDLGFACPWFRTFDQAYNANPFPLPFDGVNWPASGAGCIVP